MLVQQKLAQQVFTIAILRAKFLLANERPSCAIYQFTDQPSIVLALLGATIGSNNCSIGEH